MYAALNKTLHKLCEKFVLSYSAEVFWGTNGGRGAINPSLSVSIGLGLDLMANNLDSKETYCIQCR